MTTRKRKWKKHFQLKRAFKIDKRCYLKSLTDLFLIYLEIVWNPIQNIGMHSFYRFEKWLNGWLEKIQSFHLWVIVQYVETLLVFKNSWWVPYEYSYKLIVNPLFNLTPVILRTKVYLQNEACYYFWLSVWQRCSEKLLARVKGKIKWKDLYLYLFRG